MTKTRPGATHSASEKSIQSPTNATTTTTSSSGVQSSTATSKRLQNDLVRMVYGYGDEKQPLKESIELLENMVQEYIYEMCQQVNK